MALGSELAFFIAAFSSLFTIVNPFSTTSVFLSITRGDSQKKRDKMIKRASIVAACVLIVFALMGNYILSFFSVTVDAFRIAGGLIVASVGWRMLILKREHLKTPKEKRAARQKEDISIVPLAIPMISGPGAITTAIVLAGDASGIRDVFVLLIAVIVVCWLTYFIVKESKLMDDKLGVTGRKVLDRIMGLIVLVVGVQFIINGIVGIARGF
jgi:multiple antibiotic resistance protein